MAFQIMKTNYVTFEDDDTIKPIKFRPFIQFLTKFSSVHYALVEEIPLDEQMLEQLYRSAEFTKSAHQISFTAKVRDDEFTVTDHDVNEILRFPTDNLVALPSYNSVIDFFRLINSQGNFLENGKNLEQKHLVAEWNYFALTINLCFATRASGHHHFSIVVQHIIHAVATGIHINFGRLILEELSRKMKPLQNRDLKCCYPRFLMLILKDKLSVETFNYFDGFKTTSPRYTAASLKIIGNKHLGVEVLLTEHIKQQLKILNQPVDEALNLAPVAAPVEAPVQVTLNTEVQGTMNNASPVEVSVTETLNTMRDTITSVALAQPLVAIVSSSHQVEHPTPVTQIQNPNTSQTPPTKIIQKMQAQKSVRGSIQGVTIPVIANQDGSVGTQTALPMHKRARIGPQATVSPSVSSQEDLDLEMAINISLQQASQQVCSIEIGSSARATDKCHSPEVTLLGENQNIIPFAQIQNTHGEDQGGFRVSIDSKISSPVPMEVDPSMGNQTFGNDSEIVGNETIPVFEPTERLNEEKQNQKRGEGEMSEKKSEPLNLAVHEKEKECLSKDLLPNIPSTSNVVSSLIPTGSNKDDQRIDKAEWSDKGELKLQMEEMKKTMQIVLEKVSSLSSLQGNVILETRGIRVDVDMKLKKVQENTNEMQLYCNRLAKSYGFIEGHTLEHTKLLQQQVAQLEKQDAQLEKQDAQLQKQDAQIKYLTEGLEAVYKLVNKQPSNTTSSRPLNDKRDPPSGDNSTKGENSRGKV